MKKIVTIVTAIVCALLIACSYATPACAEAEAEANECYWRLFVVISCEDLPEERLVSCEDRYGMVWQFYDDEFEWDVGDYGTMKLWKCTEDPYDDEVMDVQWLGYTENPTLFWHAKKTW